MQAVTDGDDEVGEVGEVDEVDEVDQEDDSADSRSRLLMVLAVVAVVALAVGAFRIVTLTSDRSSLQERVEQLEESLRIARGDAGAQIEQLEAEVEALTERIAVLEDALSATTSDLDGARDEIDDLTARLDERRAERDELQEQIEELQDIVDVVGTDVALMPDLFGVPIDDVVELADELRVELVVVEVAPNNVIARPGDVIEQLPIEDTPLLPGSVVWVEVYTPDNDE